MPTSEEPPHTVGVTSPLSTSPTPPLTHSVSAQQAQKQHARADAERGARETREASAEAAACSTATATSFSGQDAPTAGGEPGHSPPPPASLPSQPAASASACQKEARRRRTEEREDMLTLSDTDEEGEAEETIPRVLLLRHRMGYSTVELSKKQRNTFSRNDLEDFLLYKEQKYNAVNVLGRFCVFLLLVSTFAVYCLIFSLCSTDWQVVRYEGFFQSMGFFMTCRERLLRQCTQRISSFFPRAVVDPETGTVVCSVSRATARGYIGAMWAMAVVHLVCQTLVLCLTIQVACRPTRSKVLVWVEWLLLGCVVAGVVNCVLFPFYVRCDRRTCAARRLASNTVACDRYYGWGYDTYIAATALHALCLFIAVSMSTYISRIRITARRQLQQERQRKNVEKTAEAFVQEIIDERGAALSRAKAHSHPPNPQRIRSRSGAAAPTPATANERSLRATAGHLTHTFTSAGGGGTPLLTRSTQSQWLQQLSRQPAMNSVTITREGDPRKPRRKKEAVGFTFQHTLTRPASDKRGGGGRRGKAGAFSAKPSPTAAAGDDVAAAAASRMAGLKVSLAPSTRGSFIFASEQATPTPGTARVGEGPHFLNTNRDNNTSGSRQDGKGEGVWRQEPVEYRHARKQRKRLLRIFNRDYDPAYLTAAELGVPIEGADDWVYDDKSDMYYSFDRDMFWDPLTGEYFNCALRTWQENPDSIVDVRDAMEYAWEDGYDYDGDGYADYGDDPEQQLAKSEEEDPEER